jgi:hypothetical protein
MRRGRNTPRRCGKFNFSTVLRYFAPARPLTEKVLARRDCNALHNPALDVLDSTVISHQCSCANPIRNSLDFCGLSKPDMPKGLDLHAP